MGKNKKIWLIIRGSLVQVQLGPRTVKALVHSTSAFFLSTGPGSSDFDSPSNASPRGGPAVCCRDQSCSNGRLCDCDQSCSNCRVWCKLRGALQLKILYDRPGRHYFWRWIVHPDGGTVQPGAMSAAHSSFIPLAFSILTKQLPRGAVLLNICYIE